jgi:hypothetical protein
MTLTAQTECDTPVALARRLVAPCLVAILASFAPLTTAAAQAQDPSGLKRAFLDRYLDCAEAPDDAARLACYDALLADIPAWLEDPNDPPPALRTNAPQLPASTQQSDSK